MSTEAYVLNIHQQPDGTCIISLPDDFTGEAIVNIHRVSSEHVSHMLDADDNDATDSAIVEEVTSDQSSDDVEENVDDHLHQPLENGSDDVKLGRKIYAK